MKSVPFLAKLILKNKRYMIWGIIFTALMSITEIFPGMIYKVIADSLSNLTAHNNFLSVKIPIKIMDIKFDAYTFSLKESDKIFNFFLLICFLFVIIYILDGLFRYLRDIFFNFAIQNILKEIKDLICEKLLTMPYNSYQKNQTGDLLSRITYDVSILNNIIDVFVEISRSLIGLIIFCPILFYIDYKISFFATLFFPVSLYLIKFLSYKMKKYSTNISKTTADYTEFLKDRIDRYQSIKLGCKENDELALFQDLTAQKLKLAKRNIIIKFILKPTNEIIGIVGIALIAVYFCYMIITKEMSLGNVALYLAILKSAYKPFKKVAESIGDLNFSLAGADKIVALLSTPSEPLLSAEIGELKKITEIKFDKCQLKLDNKIIFDHLSLSFESGKYHGITGESGVGKSCLVRLIPNFLIVSSGELLINGQNITNIPLQTLRQKIALVNNDNFIIDSTLENNLLYGTALDYLNLPLHPNFNPIIDFLNIEDFDLTNILGKNGKELSSGQKQKINLVNGLLKEADIFIIDEGLDLLSHCDIAKFFNLMSKERIVIIISRNDFVLSFMDDIFCMK